MNNILTNGNILPRGNFKDPIMFLDLDNCLFHDSHRRHKIRMIAANNTEQYQDYHAAHVSDYAYAEAVKIQDIVEHLDYHVVIVTGRPIKHLSETLKQLNNFYPRIYENTIALLMRPENNWEETSVLKPRLIRDFMAGEVEVKCTDGQEGSVTETLWRVAVDDDPRNLNAYARMGLATILCHAEYNIIKLARTRGGDVVWPVPATANNYPESCMVSPDTGLFGFKSLHDLAVGPYFVFSGNPQDYCLENAWETSFSMKRKYEEMKAEDRKQKEAAAPTPATLPAPVKEKITPMKPTAAPIAAKKATSPVSPAIGYCHINFNVGSLEDTCDKVISTFKLRDTARNADRITVSHIISMIAPRRRLSSIEDFALAALYDCALGRLFGFISNGMNSPHYLADCAGQLVQMAEIVGGTIDHPAKAWDMKTPDDFFEYVKKQGVDRRQCYGPVGILQGRVMQMMLPYGVEIAGENDNCLFLMVQALITKLVRLGASPTPCRDIDTLIDAIVYCGLIAPHIENCKIKILEAAPTTGQSL